MNITKENKRQLRLNFDIHKILIQYSTEENYQEKVCQITRKIINPDTIVDEMLSDNSEQDIKLISMLFDRYKLTRSDIDPEMKFRELNMVDKRKAVFDMLKDSGVFITP